MTIWTAEESAAIRAAMTQARYVQPVVYYSPRPELPAALLDQSVVFVPPRPTRDLVLELRAAGMSKRQIARELGIARSRVREICAAARGAPKRRGRRRG